MNNNNNKRDHKKGRNNITSWYDQLHKFWPPWFLKCTEGPKTNQLEIQYWQHFKRNAQPLCRMWQTLLVCETLLVLIISRTWPCKAIASHPSGKPFMEITDLNPECITGKRLKLLDSVHCVGPIIDILQSQIPLTFICHFWKAFLQIRLILTSTWRNMIIESKFWKTKIVKLIRRPNEDM